ncbi:SNARE associated golgi protein [Oxobacter pfennigii]|uniref:SNARE associated golgi protein n=1 Tax=Oxobacter pfennigii TaxID=36849 RepID=A0A0P8WVF8_9CLOT|nr:YqaA family protein [Oxobacter pfennigii]KPU42231.1 SNARE associated golgi protein [Oxobacter pfennigii]KPU42235.1 SNARE associated golgi protein [Oxobacter pfennigii]
MENLITFLSKYGIFGVLLAAFFEPIIFPPPVEIVLLPVMLSNQDKAILISLVTVCVSFIGGMVGYNLGKIAGRPLIIKMFGNDALNKVEEIYNKYGIFAVMTSSFTPIPYEVYTLSAGAFRMNFYRYLIATCLCRLLRYVPEGILIQLFGHAMSKKTFESVTFVAIALIAVFIIYIIIKRYARK